MSLVVRLEKRYGKIRVRVMVRLRVLFYRFLEIKGRKRSLQWKTSQESFKG